MGDQTRVLVVDDEKAIRKFLHASLSAYRYAIVEAATGAEALARAAEYHPELIILDLGLPDMDGIEVTQQLRGWTQTPIIILSVRDQEEDKIRALDAGADDYLTKPFGVGELLARIRVAIRHTVTENPQPIFQTGDLVVDLSRRLVTVKGVEVSLTPTEYDLLRAMVQKAGRVLTHRHLIQQVWGAAYEADAHILRVNISNLRRKLEPDLAQPRYILTEPGVGYRLKTGD